MAGPFGVTPQGLVIKRLADIRLEMNEDARGVYGVAVDLDVRRPLGQFITIQAERISQIWELLEQIYNSFSPRNSEGKQFDEVAAYAGLQRRSATFSKVGVKLYGIQGTVVPSGSRASVTGNPEAVFKTNAAYTIGAGTNEVQELMFTGEPVAGQFTLVFQGQSTAAINWNATAGQLKTALESLSTIDTVNVQGDFYGGFLIEFTGDNGEAPQPMIALGTNTLSSDGVEVGDIDVTVAEVTPGEEPNVSGFATAVSAGPVPAAAASLTVLEDTVSGWTGITNPEDADEGLAEESDAEFKIRRVAQIASAGRCTPNAIRARMLAVPEVISATIYVNNEDFTVGDLPPHSVRAVLLGGQPAAIAAQLFDSVAAGIKTYGAESYILEDDSGFDQEIRWDESVPVPIWITVDLEVDDDFPEDGEDQLIASILAFGDALGTGDDVIVYPYLMCTLDVTPGIVNAAIKVGKTINPTLDDNITIAPDELAKFDSSRIVLNFVS